MRFIITDKVIRQAWGSSSENWFSRTDYCIHSTSDLGTNDEIQLLENGFIPFVALDEETVMRAYLNQKNKRLKDTLKDVKGEEFIEKFWKYFNAYKDIQETYEPFERSFVLDEIKNWCDENSIKYEIV